MPGSGLPTPRIPSASRTGGTLRSAGDDPGQPRPVPALGILHRPASRGLRTAPDPFVAPSGDRLDEIVRAARDCPSGALSFAIEEGEARDVVDWGGHWEPAIEVTRDGPYRITGGVTLVGADGIEVERNAGASLEHCALCRCGHSQNKPFCSGMHWYA